MTSEKPPGADPADLPGNVQALYTEAQRLRQLSLALDELAAGLRLTAPESWSGSASEAYAECRDAQVKHCMLASDSHLAAADAVFRYATVVEELRRHAHSAPSERLRPQYDTAAQEAAAILVRAADDLTNLEAILQAEPEPSSSGKPPPRPSHPPPPMAGAADTSDELNSLDPSAKYLDPVRHRQVVRSLNDAAFAFWSRPVQNNARSVGDPA
jgi:hypothetical protein